MLLFPKVKAGVFRPPAMKRTEEELNGETKRYYKAVEKVRDILKGCCVKTAGEVTYLIIGIENQEDMHYAMVVRNMLYDALNYTSQVEQHAKEHRQKKDVTGAEFLSGFSKEDTLVPEEIEDFGNFKTELGTLFEFICCASDGDKLEKAMEEKGTKWSTLSNEAIDLLNICLDAKLEIENIEKGDGNVCKGIEEYAEKREARAVLNTLLQLVRDGLLSASVGAERAGMSEKEFQKLLYE